MQQSVEMPEAVVTTSARYSDENRQLEVTIDVMFANDQTGEFRIAGIVVEDGVTGTGSTWGQSNYYAGGGRGPMGGFENRPSKVPASEMVYNHTARALLGGYNGLSGVIPAQAISGTTYSHTFTYSVPDNFNPEQLYAVVNEFVTKSSKSIILLDGVEYLIHHNNFTTVLHLVEQLRDLAGTHNTRIILPAYPGAIEDQELKLIERETKPVPKRRGG